MRRQALWVVLAATLALGACAAGPSPKLADLRPEPAKACADWRWIAVLSRSAATAVTCPQIDGWEAKRLFQRPAQREEPGYSKAAPVVAPAEDQLPASAALAELNRFCVYQAPDARGKADKLRFPPAESPDIVRFDRDCAAFSIAGELVSATTDWQPVAAEFLAQSGLPPAPLQIRNRRGVRLAFLDTQPTTDDFNASTPRGYSWHGYTLAHIARQLICSPSTSDDCAARITTRLALGVGSFDAASRARTTFNPRGGHIGMQSDVAKAITDEVRDWLAARSLRRDAPQHLVLNLSLAWDPRLFGGLDKAQVAELSAGTQAVYRALQYAADSDVLVLAAAGNKKLCPGVPPEGPMLPAAWEIEGPAADSCSPADGPIVYAVGGLGGNGAPLWNARDHGMPRRAAYAEHAVVSTWAPDRPTAMYTGSSVATAVASSIAAIVWDTVPSLSARQVMGVLETATSRNVLDLDADFWRGSRSWTGGPAPKVHRLTLCDALEVACLHPDAVNCPLPSGSECAVPAPPRYASKLPRGGTIPTTCQPWVFPQPEEPPCPVCRKEPP